MQNGKNKRVLIFIISDNRIRSNAISSKRKRFSDPNECSFFLGKHRKPPRKKHSLPSGTGNKHANTSPSESLTFPKNTDSLMNRSVSRVLQPDGDRVVVAILSTSLGNSLWHLLRSSTMSWYMNSSTRCTKITLPNSGNLWNRLFPTGRCTVLIYEKMGGNMCYRNFKKYAMV